MTAQFLTNELTNLVQEAKRKNSDLRHAAEKSLADLKSIGSATDVVIATSELSGRPQFIHPFLIACSTRNAKFSTIGVVCLQRLIVSQGLAKVCRQDILTNLSIGVEIQLKILQALPPLLQNYAEDLKGNLLGEALLICSMLQGSKMGVVNNTAAATLSQIVISIFDKVVTEDERALEVPTVGEGPSESGTIPLRAAALDAYRVFFDICLLTEGQRPQFLRFSVLPQPFGLELIESVLTNHPDIFLTHPEQAYVLKTRVAPLIMRSLSDRLNFPTTVRITRVLYILLRRHLSILSEECEVALSILTHTLDPEASASWKRALCMEVFRGICAEPGLIRKIFAGYDAKEGKKPIMKDLMGALTRLATEKPTALEAGGVAGIIGGAVGLSEVNVVGLSTQWSLVRVPCIDQLDKSEPPAMPESYIYCLTLTCINSFCEGLAKFILPLSMTGDATKGAKRRTPARVAPSPVRTPSPTKGSLRRKSTMKQHRIPVNPLSMEGHPLYNEIVISAAIMESCWPAVLAACSTFLYATLDNEFYHGLVRSFQKFTHVAGLLRLTTPRDAFLTTLGKAAVPSNVLSANISASPMASDNQSLFSNAKGLLSVDSLNSSERLTTGGTEHHPPSLNSRNLLCLRALLNLGIALGPTLEKSWTIVLETLQQADYVLFASSRKTGRQISLNASTARSDSQKGADAGNPLVNIGPELSAVETAAMKMFEGTRDFPDNAFAAVLSALCKLSDGDGETNSRTSIDKSTSPQRSPRSPTFSHKHTSSVPSLSTSQVIGDNAFALAKLGELAQINMSRLIGPNPNSTGWDMLANHLATIASSRDRGNSIRMKAAEVLNEVVVSAAKAIITESTENVAEVQKRILSALREGITDGKVSGAPDSVTRATELEVHRAGLEALNAILEHSGQSLIAGWEIVFDIIMSVFDTTMIWRRDATIPEAPAEVTKSTRSPKLIRSSFSSLELICSDFLASLPTPCVLVLIDALFAFCGQADDLNISLTTITFFWNVSDFLQTKGESSLSGEFVSSKAQSETDLLGMVEQTDVDSHPALWMLLLLRLTGVSKDQRAEVRNGSVQTLFRIFDTYGHQLGPQAWSSCLKIVVFKMMNIAPSDEESDVPKVRAAERKQWDDTINLVLNGIGTLYSNYFEVFVKQSEFRSTWNAFTRYLEALLERRSFEVNTTVFMVLKHVLEKVDRPDNLDQSSTDDVWKMWSGQGVKLVEGNTEVSRAGIQETLLAYVDSFKPLYRLLEPIVNADMVEKTLILLWECITFPDAPAYFQDIDILTPLQAAILEVTQMIRTDIPGIPSLVLKQVADFSTIAYRPPHTSQSTKVRIPTYIALATQSMKILETVSFRHVENSEIYTTGSLSSVLSALKLPISLKYDFTGAALPATAKRPSQWIPATKVVLSIITKALPAISKLDIGEVHQKEVWKLIVEIIGSVVSANTTNIDEATLISDETFDISSFEEFRGLIIPPLGHAIVPDEVVQAYVKSIFKSSILYDIVELEHPTSMDVSLSSLSIRKHGKTSELELVRRSRMSYACLDELFALAAANDSDSKELQRLTAAVAPYLVLRAGRVLQRYISDQPLRGRMPQPVCQRKEMIYVLKCLVNLESRVKTVSTDSGHIPLSGKRHTSRLFPLLSQCVAAAQGDQEVLGWLAKVMDEIGGALGVL
ncbi:unnamed protein product [Tuber melanosporum]|uniref:(Perigord truffle) hypothetical protein n=1 Tax=Tuber melanosporum (strain Mel28) TaxID=656061 RepID=D5G9F5_TUBMM|nr:uncharacterized protein GSTUM_00003289001 [Tuber melanosporum]CAZ81148.1 unnamed protein product [Tuber melanosporum]